jgi:hypothetical protein
MAMDLQGCDAQPAEKAVRGRPNGHQQFGVFLIAPCWRDWLQFSPHGHMKLKTL